MDNLKATAAFAALSQETRLTALRALVEHGRSGIPAGGLADQLAVPHNTLSFHLSHLQRAGLVEARRNGRQMIYAAKIDVLQNLAHFLMENCCIRETRESSDSFPCVPRIPCPISPRPERPVSMTKIQIFDPALCCSTGVCGVDVDQQKVTFAADVDWLKSQGGQIERFNLAQQPMAFAENPLVKSFLERSGADALPLVLIDGEVALAGRYPHRAELAKWANVGLELLQFTQSGSCCGGGLCS